MSLNVIVTSRKTGVYIVKPKGRLDTETYLILDEKIASLLEPATRVLILDMSELDYISSAGVRVVFKTKKSLNESGGEFMMTNLKPQIRKVFEIINALPTISIFKNVDEADAYLDAMQRKEIEKQKESG
ncbi:MAG: STAS domain-containing protein [Deltaproteobacteria bacterium]|nr:STAS domain-containing protein [Deltaproteobacteria bacterium]MBW1942104.1 STAS domain-containing protein [Deltaproteobacteria bacterium]MBW2206050.1 STAS domain-containing protein [Deltaproteobacteria bacterium]